MSLNTIVVIEDNLDDQNLIVAALKEMVNKPRILFYDNSHSALEFLRKTPRPPRFVLCDFRLKGINGLELHNKLKSSDERYKMVPFILYSGEMSDEDIGDALRSGINSCVDKDGNFMDKIRRIIDYWTSVDQFSVLAR